MQKELIVQIAARYGLSAVSVSDVQKGYRNQSWHVVDANGKDYNLIIYKQEEGILRRIHSAHTMGLKAYNAGLPVRYPIDSRITVLGTKSSKRYAALYNYLPGHTIPWEGYTMEHIKLLGEHMSNLHAATAYLSPKHFPSVAAEYISILKRMESYFSDTQIQAALASKLRLSLSPRMFLDYIRIVQACDALQHQQALHMDLVRSNVLFDPTAEGLKITGILDFEKAAWGHPVFDIARTLAFLLVDCKYKDPAKVTKYFLYSGYAKRGQAPLRRVNICIANRSYDMQQQLIYLFLLYDYYKFLRHNPYESLQQNEHFVRTKNILVGEGLLTVV